jgi:hypothetical protein
LNHQIRISPAAELDHYIVTGAVSIPSTPTPIQDAAKMLILEDTAS